MVVPDPTEEIKAIRHQLGAEFDYDLDRIFEDIQRQQAQSGLSYVVLQPRKVTSGIRVQASSPESLQVNGESTLRTGERS